MNRKRISKLVPSRIPDSGTNNVTANMNIKQLFMFNKKRQIIRLARAVCAVEQKHSLKGGFYPFACKNGVRATDIWILDISPYVSVYSFRFDS